MENIKIANICGLCAGCKFAINTTKAQKKNNNSVTLFKEIVHNENVNLSLKNIGIAFKDKIEDLSSDELVIIRAHGEPKKTFEYINKKGISYIDCTCVNVKNIHNLVEEYSKNGYTNIIIGKYGKVSKTMHPEILGTIGWSQSEPILIEDEEDLKKIENFKNQKFYLTCQTTFNELKADKLIEKITEILQNNNNLITINKSICSAQKVINESSMQLANISDLMLVVGSKSSSNTTELYNNLKNICTTVFIDDINNYKQILKNENITFSKNTKIGITAGASTDPE